MSANENNNCCGIGYVLVDRDEQTFVDAILFSSEEDAYKDAERRFKKPRSNFAGDRVARVMLVEIPAAVKGAKTKKYKRWVPCWSVSKGELWEVGSGCLHKSRAKANDELRDRLSKMKRGWSVDKAYVQEYDPDCDWSPSPFR